MKLVTPIVGIIGGIVLLLPGPSAAATRVEVDCEAARCTIQDAIDTECPCAEATHHGRYIACVKRVVNRSVRQGLVPKQCRSKMSRCAMRSTCGTQDGAVSCGSLPGKDFPGDTDGRCRVIPSEARCLQRGGLVVASCCESCGAPEPTATPTEGAPVPTLTPVEPTATAEAPTATATPEEPFPTETATPEEPGATPTATIEVPIATATETPGPGATETATPDEPAATPTATEEATATPTPVATEEATATPTPVATEEATATPTPVATEEATATPTPIATEEATATPTPVATEEATATPTATETAGETPTASPTESPVETPSPTATPSVEPTASAACGNSTIEAGEDCDPPGQSSCPNAGNGLEICSLTCQCNCPTRLAFTGDATDPATLLDTGWTGIAHRSPVISNGDVTVGITCAAEGRPCGTCTVAGPIPNTLPNQIDNQRCTNDSSIHCTDDGPCTGGGGTCEFFFGAPLPLAAGGVGTCVTNQFNGPIGGTADIESGEAATTALLTSRVFTGPIDNPCPRCTDTGGINDGVLGGTCDDGLRLGLSCDANGFVPSRPDFGRTSLDCPPKAELQVAALPIDLSNETNTVTKTLTSASPNCGDGSGMKCLCETCNNAAATTCDSNADCVAVGATVCGGRRCVGGTNDGGVCNTSTACPGEGICGRVGEPSKPGACLDDTSTVGVFDCSDPDGDEEGTCTSGPVTKTCSVASGHAQRSCGGDAECGGGAGSCVATNRRCFLTGGLTLFVGTNTLVADGVEDPPMNDVSHPTLAAVFCVGPTAADAVNTVGGLPGPGRVTIRGTALGLP